MARIVQSPKENGPVFVPCCRFKLRSPWIHSSELMLQRDSKRVERIVMRGEKCVTVSNGYASKVRIRGNCISTGIQLFPRGRVKNVQLGMSRGVPLREATHHPV